MRAGSAIARAAGKATDRTAIRKRRLRRLLSAAAVLALLTACGNRPRATGEDPPADPVPVTSTRTAQRQAPDNPAMARMGALVDPSLRAGREFLIKQQLSAGNFRYRYDIRAGRAGSGDHQMAQLQALWTLVRVHRVMPGADSLQAIRRAVQFAAVNSRLRPTGEYLCYPGDQQGATGAMAVLVLALQDLVTDDLEGLADERDAYRDYLRDSLKFLLSLRTDNGFFRGYYRLNDGVGVGIPVPAFDGAALLAMVRAARDGEADLRKPVMTSMQAMYEAYIKIALANDPNSQLAAQFYPWIIAVWSELQQTDWGRREIHARWTVALTRWMVEVYLPRETAANPIFAGQAVTLGLALARELGDAATVRQIEAGLAKLITRAIACQVGGPAPCEELRLQPCDDHAAQGGVLARPGEPWVRIDDAADHLAALLTVRELCRDQ